MRGEHSWDGIVSKKGRGSSPHARGTHDGRIAGRYRDGIIPACAGNTIITVLTNNGERDHPRMRGEHTIESANKDTASGSSPHARGTRQAGTANVFRPGIIPACAGNTAFSSLARLSNWDHPRMRGEHTRGFSLPKISRGSSPHARGTLAGIGHLRPQPGIIPACAGNTEQTDAAKVIWRDHPRMRGEHCVMSWLVLLSMGSSPHARGTLDVECGGKSLDGIIPACAGNTGQPTAVHHGRRDHPRMRGEHLGTQYASQSNRGSSPHARGTLRPRSARSGSSGIIPACAGNTSWRHSSCRRFRDHPRMRGEHQ